MDCPVMKVDGEECGCEIQARLHAQVGATKQHRVISPRQVEPVEEPTAVSVYTEWTAACQSRSSVGVVVT